MAMVSTFGFNWSMKEISDFVAKKSQTWTVFSSEPVKPSTPQWIIDDCVRLEEQSKVLKAQIAKLRFFFEEHPPLKSLAQQYLQTHAHFIAVADPVPKLKVEEDDWIGKRGALLIEVNMLSHDLNEQKEFIKRHGDLFILFSEAVKRMQEASIPSIQFRIPTVIVTDENGANIQ